VARRTENLAKYGQRSSRQTRTTQFPHAFSVRSCLNLWRSSAAFHARPITIPAGRKDEVFSYARPEPSGAYKPELSISNGCKPYLVTYEIEYRWRTSTPPDLRPSTTSERLFCFHPPYPPWVRMLSYPADEVRSSLTFPPIPLPSSPAGRFQPPPH